MRSVNLLPWRAQQHRKRRRNALLAMVFALAAALGTVAGTDLLLRLRLETVRQQTSEARAEIELHRAASAKRDELAGRRSEVNALIEELERINHRNGTAREWLALLPGSLPPGLRLTRLTISGKTWEIQGVAGGLDQAAQFIGVLRTMPMVADARIENLSSGAIESPQFLLAGAFRK